jgi:hypothetical protein
MIRNRPQSKREIFLYKWVAKLNRIYLKKQHDLKYKNVVIRNLREYPAITTGHEGDE